MTELICSICGRCRTDVDHGLDVPGIGWVHSACVAGRQKVRIDQLTIERNAALSREREANRDWSTAAKQWSVERKQLQDKIKELKDKAEYLEDDVIYLENHPEELL